MKKTRPLTIAVASALFLTAGVAFAQDSIQLPPSVRPQKIEVREKTKDIRVERVELKDAAKNVRENFQNQIKVLKQDTREEIKESTSSTERRDVIKNALEERRGIVEDRRASTTEMKRQLGVLARQHVGLVVQRFFVALKQFDNFVSRIQSRIDKLKANGVDTSRTDALFATAKGAVAQVKTDVQALSDLVAGINNASDVKTIKSQVDAGVKKATASIKTAHYALNTVANSLVTLARSQNKNTGATSTSEDSQ